MSTPAKLRGAGSGKPSELTRLKALPPEDRAEIYSWRDEQPTLTNAAIRTRIGEKFGIALRADKQLSEFWSWQFRQAPLDHLNRMMNQDEQYLRDNCPQLSLEQLRELTIKRGYAVADAVGDLKLGMAVVKTDLKVSADKRDWQKMSDARKTKLDLALDELAETLKQHPDLMKEFQGWRARLGERLEAN